MIRKNGQINRASKTPTVIPTREENKAPARVYRTKVNRHRIENGLGTRHDNGSCPSGKGVAARLLVKIQQKAHRRAVGKQTHNTERNQRRWDSRRFQHSSEQVSKILQKSR